MSLDDYREKYFSWYKKQNKNFNLMEASHKVFGGQMGLINVHSNIADNVDMDGLPFGYNDKWYEQDVSERFQKDIRYIYYT